MKNTLVSGWGRGKAFDNTARLIIMKIATILSNDIVISKNVRYLWLCSVHFPNWFHFSLNMGLVLVMD